ncbi:formylglycine-generating enzyme family protein [Flavobacterium limnosediminis]|nr:SUMF1/EgtB/PvdO family nonheme iron enzyme [Flavobacterium limnosediminis]
MKKNYVVLGISALALFLCSFYNMGVTNPKMVLVEGGKVKMKPNVASKPDSKEKNPDYEVAVSSFEISKNEVTVANWKEYTTSTKTAMPARPSWGWNDDNPITNITWKQAVQYCNWLSKENGLKPAYTKNGDKYTCNFKANGYRLPTDAEWVFAAKGGNKSKNYKYSGGNDLESVAWYAKNSEKAPKAFGTKLPNELGLFDMSGNVWEWCWDYYSSVHYKIDSKVDPAGPERGEKRCVRGGSWDSSKLEYLEPSYQLTWNPNATNEFFGFRVVRTITK